MMHSNIPASEALKRLRDGNARYIEALHNDGDISAEIRKHTAEHGQAPYAIIIGCSDSRAIPESIFMAGIGELFVIRVAGNVIDSHQLGSIEYAAEHLGCRLVVVLGHDHCGAVDAAIHHDPDGYIKFITDEISLAACGHTDPDIVTELNVKRSIAHIESNIDIQHMEQDEGLKVIGAIYHLESGRVDFME